jgi:hypothetical protein
MKVHDILTEAGPTSYVPASPGSPIVVPTPLTPTPGSPSPAPVPSSPTSPKPGTPITNAPKSKTFKNPLDKLYKSIELRAKRNNARIARMEAKFNNGYGWRLKLLFRLMGLVVPTVNLYNLLEEIDEWWRQGKIDNEDNYNDLRDLAYGTYQTAILAPILIRWLARLVRLTSFLNWIKRIAAFASAPVTGGLTLAAALATEAGVLWFQNWLTSPAGQDWIINSIFMDIVKNFGKVGSTGVDLLAQAFGQKGALDRVKEKPPLPGKDDTDKDRGQGTQDREAPEPARGASYSTDVRYSRAGNVYVGNVLVTDQDGYVDPKKIDLIPVQSARSTAVRRGQPDPIEGIPQRPGKPVEIMKQLDKPVAAYKDPRPDF